MPLSPRSGVPALALPWLPLPAGAPRPPPARPASGLWRCPGAAAAPTAGGLCPCRRRRRRRRRRSRSRRQRCARAPAGLPCPPPTRTSSPPSCATCPLSCTLTCRTASCPTAARLAACAPPGALRTLRTSAPCTLPLCLRAGRRWRRCCRLRGRRAACRWCAGTPSACSGCCSRQPRRPCPCARCCSPRCSGRTPPALPGCWTLTRPPRPGPRRARASSPPAPWLPCSAAAPPAPAAPTLRMTLASLQGKGQRPPLLPRPAPRSRPGCSCASWAQSCSGGGWWGALGTWRCPLCPCWRAWRQGGWWHASGAYGSARALLGSARARWRQ